MTTFLRRSHLLVLFAAGVGSLAACSTSSAGDEGGASGDTVTGAPDGGGSSSRIGPPLTGGTGADASAASGDGATTEPLACSAVGDLRATATSASSVALAWQGATGVTYVLSRKSYCGSDAYAVVARLPAGSTSYNDTAVNAGWVYWYELTATDPSGAVVSATFSVQASADQAGGCSGGAFPQQPGGDLSACAADGGMAVGADGGSGDGGASTTGPANFPPPPAIPAGAATVTCTGSAGDAALLQAALDANPAVVASGTCDLGSTALKLKDSQFFAGAPSSAATLKYSGSDYAVTSSASGVTVSQLTFDGGGLILDNTGAPQSGWTIVYNTFQNIVSGANGVYIQNILGEGAASRIGNNTFENIWQGGYPNLPAGKTAGSCDQDCLYGGGIFWDNGLDNTVIDSNVMDRIGWDGIKGFWDGFSGQTGAYTAKNVVVSNNVITNYHRIAIEVQGVGKGSCPGGCDYSLNTNDGTVFKGNYVHLPALDNNQFAFSLMTNGTNAQLINNTGNNDVASCYVRAGIGLENSLRGGIAQGNVIGSIPQSCSSVGWADFVSCGYASGTNYYSNNVICGPGAAAQNSVDKGEDPDDNATQVETADLWTDTCPAAPALGTSKIALTLSPGAGATGTWNAAVVSNLSIRDVRFYLDGATTPLATQEVSDVSKTFAADQAWQYHATIDPSTLAAGAHTVKAVATDVAGTAQAQTASFTR